MEKRPLQRSPMSLRSTANPSQKGWSSERVPLPSKSPLLALSNGRALPSKWDDAEKWIFNPVSGEGNGGSPFLSLQRPKSKSGPLRTPPVGGAGSQSSVEMPVSAEIPMRRNILGTSPFLTGVLMPDQGHYRSLHGEENGTGGVNKRMSVSSSAARAVGFQGWSDLSTASSSSSERFQDDDQEIVKESAIMFSPEIQRREMGTQISPECSESTSPNERTQSPPSFFNAVHSHLSKLDIRDVQVDDLVVKRGWPKALDDHVQDRSHVASADWRKNHFMESRCPDWQASYSAKYSSKLKRREAKIIAWENLKKAEAEAEISKLEMKLEKKRSSEMEKIMRNLRHAQEKAKDMRNALETSKSDDLESERKELPSSFWKKMKKAYFCGGFTC
ncbi:uncharacterized protein LOC144711418 [Wolffia australiana]